MIAALDLGCTEFRSLRREQGRLVARRLPAVYTVLADTPAQRRALEQARVAWSLTEGSLVVIGDHALDVAELFARPLIPLFAQGQLPEQDPIARQVCAWMIDVLLPVAQGGLCCIANPSGTADEADRADRTSRFIAQLIGLRGYDIAFRHPATALALAELEETEYTGASLTLGAESVGFSLIHHSRTLVEAGFQRGVREVLDAFAHEHRSYLWDRAGNTYVDLPAIHRWLAQGELNLHSGGTDQQGWLARQMSEFLLTAWGGLQRHVSRCRHAVLNRPLPLVISGELTQIAGFTELVAESLRISRMPLIVSEVRTARFDPFAIARGLLIQGALRETAVARAA